MKLEGKIKVTIDPENEAKGRSKEIVYCLEHKHWGCKIPPIAILTTKIIKTCFSQVAISKKICNLATVNCYIHILTGTSCKISLIYFIPLCGPTSLFPHSLFSHISASLSLSLLSSHPLSLLFVLFSPFSISVHWRDQHGALDTGFYVDTNIYGGAMEVVGHGGCWICGWLCWLGLWWWWWCQLWRLL